MIRRIAGVLLGLAAPASAQAPDTMTVRIVDTDLRVAIQLLGRHLSKPVITANLPSVKVSLETPRPVRPSETAELLRGLAEAHGLRLVEDSSFYQVTPKPDTAQSVAPAGPIALHVVRLKHARAVDAAATVAQLFGVGGGFSGRGGLSTGTLGDELRRSQVQPVEGSTPPAPPPAGPSILTGAVSVVPEELTNSLFVRASDEDFRVIEEAVSQLDVRPLQVLIEVLIVEAQTDRHFSLGADLFVPARGPDGSVEARVTGGGLGDLVIKLLNLGRGDIDATIRSAQSKGHLDIVSRPVLIASNNTEARLLVGSQRPFVQVSRSLPTDVPTRDQVVQYRDVGTKLLVRPTINQDGYVTLAIQQEINAATSEVQFDAPVISTREASTQLLVRDGQTIVIGGLKDQQSERRQTGVPLLSGIPIIGGLFGSASRRSNSTELYLFLTPRILRGDEDADRVTAPRLPLEPPGVERNDR
ncbi:MAG: type II secretion system protein GspD [Gemmatimonadetes bacterium]|nr:type II secretion system protein GspD [Gemmatimonadota bacterium]